MRKTAMEETPRTRLNSIAGWKLGKTLGRGAYAHVRLASHPNGTQAACKILPALHGFRTTPATQDETVDAIEAHKEVVLLKALCGAGVSGVVGLEGVIEEDGWTYVFLTLHQNSASSASKNLSREDLTIFFRRLCIAVHTLHRLGISHEDIKRSNVLVDAHSCPILVDFGFSHFNPMSRLVRSSGGTLDYSSPEKVLDLSYDPRSSDVWALGIMLIKLLELPHPFMCTSSNETSENIVEKIARAPPEDRAWFECDRSGWLRDLLSRMLDKDPTRRITIPKLLKHPFLHSSHTDPKTFRLPSLQLPSDFPAPPPDSVLEDVCFLAFINQEFFLCESYKRMKEVILGPSPCWEKRWAGFLNRWFQMEELLVWEDLPARKAAKLTSVSLPKRRLGAQGRPLREIHLSPNVVKLDTLKTAAIDEVSKSKIPKARAATRRPLINQMKNKDASTSGSTIRSTIFAKAYTPTRSLMDGKNLVTPARVDFGRKKPSVRVPKLAQASRTFPATLAVATDINVPAGLPTSTRELRKHWHGQKSDAMHVEGYDGKGESEVTARRLGEDGITGAGAKPKPAGVPIRRSRRIENKENEK